MTPADDLDGTTKGSAPDRDAEDPWGDDLWDDEPAIGRRTQLYLQLGLVVAIVAILAAVVVVRSDDGDASGPKVDDPAAIGAPKTESTPSADGGAQVSTQPSAPGWPAEVNGRPKAFGELEGTPGEAPGGAEPGVYIWNDFDGWHLWVVNGGAVSGITGSIAGNDAIASAEVVPADAGTAEPDENVINFDLPAEPEIVGINFNPGFYANSLVFSLNGPTGPISSDLVHLGQGLAPAENPVVVIQVPAP